VSLGALLLGLAAAQLACPAGDLADLEPAVAAQVAVAAGRAAAAEGDFAVGLACLDRAVALDPHAALAYRARAELRAAAGELAGATADVAQAQAEGDADPETELLAAVLHARAGDRGAAPAAATRSGTWAADLVGASLDDDAAAYRAAAHLQEPSARGALAALVLAGYQARRGHRSDAFTLLDAAATSARVSGARDVARATRDLQDALHDQPPVAWAARVRATVDQLSNPGYRAPEDPEAKSSLRVGAVGEVAVASALGPARWQVELQVLQHGLLARRSRFEALDLSAYRLAGALRFPLAADPTRVVMGLAVRWIDVFGAGFDHHHAAALEGGPTLDLRLGPRVALGLAFLGAYVDFVDGSPSDQQVSAQNRDRVGQRALLALDFGLGWVDGRLEAMFINDDADGDAFDALGGALAAHLVARPTEDVGLFTGASATLREFGPVGDSAVIGAAANRREVRTGVELGARVRLAPHLELILEDVYVHSEARAGHGYTENVLSVGVESRW
jgi:tetratricopeptide (TPR) repeat protein